jgi:FkbM family methyltransferase
MERSGAAQLWRVSIRRMVQAPRFRGDRPMQVLVLNDGLAVVAARDGLFLINRKDVYVGKALEIYGEYSGAEATFLKRLVKPGDTVIEVGANIGSHTIGLAKAVGAIGKVYAFEPQRACFALLQAQIALNQAANVVAYNEGVGRTRERLWLPEANYAEPGNFAGIALSKDRTAASESVAVVPLDERLPDAPCALIKIDVEGMEEEVIRGARKLIRRRQPILYVENDRVERSKDLIAFIAALGYRLWWHLPRLFSAENFFRVKENIYGNVASFNMVCARDWHEAFAGLMEITSPDDPHPLASKYGLGG